MKTVEEFKQLKNSKEKEEYINDLLANSSVKKSIMSFGFKKNKDNIETFYTELYRLITEMKEDLSTDLVEFVLSSKGLYADESKNYPNVKKEEDVELKVTFDLEEVLNGIEEKSKKNLSLDEIEDKKKSIGYVYDKDQYTLKYKSMSKRKDIGGSEIIYNLLRSTDGSVGYDLHVDNCPDDHKIGRKSKRIELKPFQMKKYGTGIAVEVPKGYYCEVVPRSGLFKKGCEIMLANNVGIIDNDYRGEIILKLVNISDRSVLGPMYGERIAQLIVKPMMVGKFERVDELTETKRDDNGFGSTGV